MSSQYTEKDVELFNKMVIVKTERNAFYDNKLTATGLVENDEPFENSYSTASIEITLSNDHVYIIAYGNARCAEEIALEAFNHFKKVEYNEEAFEEYLIQKEKENVFEAYQ